MIFFNNFDIFNLRCNNMNITDVYKLVPGPIKIEKVRCLTTGVAIEGPFATPAFLKLNEEQMFLVESLILHSGNLKKVAEDVGISYPTLKNRLDDIITIVKQESETMKKKRQDILDLIEKGDITPEQGATLLQAL